MIDSFYRNNEKYYSKLSWEKYNSNDGIDIYSDDFYNVDSDAEYSDDSDETIPMKKIKCINSFFR